MTALSRWNVFSVIAALVTTPVVIGARPEPRVVVPVITALTPRGLYAGSPGFQLVVDGAQFEPGAQVRWNGTQRATTFVSPTRITATISPQDVATAGTIQVTVVNPSAVGGTSNAFTLPIVNAVPTIASLAPPVAPLLGEDLGLVINGTGFTPAASVRLNGAARVTTFVSSTRLVARIPASDLATPGTASIVVLNPAPGGGPSRPVSFTIATPRPVVSGIPTPLPVVRLRPVEMTFSGSNFLPQMAVRVNGAVRSRTVVSSSQVRVRLDSVDVAQAGPIEVRFENPQPTVGPAVTTLGVVNPAPVASSLAPQNVFVGSQTTTLTVTGSRFVPGAIVHANGSPRPTTFVSQTQLRASIPKSDLGQLGDLPITVVTPQPGGGTSARLNLTRLGKQTIITP